MALIPSPCCDQACAAGHAASKTLGKAWQLVKVAVVDVPIPTLAGTEALLASLWWLCAHRCSPQALHRLPPLLPGQGRHLQAREAT